MTQPISQELEDEGPTFRIVGERRPTDLPFSFEDEVPRSERWSGWKLVLAWLVILLATAALWIGIGVLGYRVGRAVTAAIAGAQCTQVPYELGARPTCVTEPRK